MFWSRLQDQWRYGTQEEGCTDHSFINSRQSEQNQTVKRKDTFNGQEIKQLWQKQGENWSLQMIRSGSSASTAGAVSLWAEWCLHHA
jgi:hypothetical protein